MFPAITQRLDRYAIKTACRSVSSSFRALRSGEAVKHPDYFADLEIMPVADFTGETKFRFPSPVPSAWPENNVIFGHLHRVPYPVPGEGRGPVVLLIHGWNGEQGYRHLFPLLARRFRRLGLAVAMIELPYHGSRKPRTGHLRNFLSGDIAHMMEATRQAIADIRATIQWLRSEGYGPVGLWGVSLGAWLGGLVACIEKNVQAAVLVTPVPRLDQAIETLEFCRHIRASMTGRDISAADLNLTAHRPRLAPEDILIVESLYDLFAPAESVEELWRAWSRPEIWRVRHGHISVLLSYPIMVQTGRWLSRHLQVKG